MPVDEEKQQPEAVQVYQPGPGPGHPRYKPQGFQPGHGRFGGKKKRTAAMAREMAAELGIDPMRYLLTLVNSETMTETQIGPKGGVKRVQVPVPQSLKVEICLAVLPFFHPRLVAKEISGPEGGPITNISVDLTQLITNPALAEQAQQLALQQAQQEAIEAQAEEISD
jgi:hypothetical protein